MKAENEVGLCRLSGSRLLDEPLPDELLSGEFLLAEFLQMRLVTSLDDLGKGLA